VVLTADPRSIATMHGDDQRSVAAVKKSSGYLPGLDGLRAISVVGVLLYHADMPWLPGGFLGVEVFFVISGYLITMLLTQEYAKTSTVSLRSFWLRRARRLLAALYTLLATVSVITLLFYREDASKLAGQVWAALTYSTNWFLIFTDQSYFALTERPLVFQHLWSLAIEEQFYLLWPLLLLGLLRLLRGHVWAITAVITAGAIASFLWMAYLFHPAMDPSRAYYGTDSRASGLLLGAALAIFWKPGHTWFGDKEVKTVALDMAGLGALAVVIGCLITFHDTDAFLYQGGFVVLSLASCVAIAATVHPGTVISRLLGAWILPWIGKRSYSLYLWHWPIYVYTQPQIDQPMSLYPTLAMRLVLTVIAAELSYRFVEVPIRNGAFARWRERLRHRDGARRRAGPIALAGAAGLLLVAVNTVGASGSSGLDELTSQGGDVTVTEQTLVDTPTSIATDPAGSVAPAGLSAVTTTTLPAPTTTASPQARTVTVLGDSVLLGAQDSITAELEASGYIVDYRAVAAEMLHQANNALIGTNTPVGETVIIGLGHNSLWERDRANFDNWAAKFDREADALIETVESLGAKKIIWVTLREPSESVIPPEGRKQFEAYVWYFPYVNERLRLLPQRHPEVILADWAAVSNQAGLTYDAMHLTKPGIRLMIDTIRQAGAI
jgi:peptidoglycan/LPS O-acetylase OafA/YrhL